MGAIVQRQTGPDYIQPAEPADTEAGMTAFVGNESKIKQADGSAWQEFPVAGATSPPEGYAGYFAGGATAGYKDIDKLSFVTDTMSLLVATLIPTGRRYSPFGISGPSFGYFAGGRDASSTDLNTMDKLTFGADTIAAAANTMSNTRFEGAAWGFATRGYAAGGAIPAITTTIDRILYAGDISTIISAVITNHGAGGDINEYDNPTHGYALGGYNNRLSVSKFTESTEVAAALGNIMASGSDGGGSFASSTDGYVWGLDTMSTNINKMDFINDTFIVFTAGTGGGTPGSCNGNLKGYTGGGGWPSNVNTVRDLTFSNDTTTVLGVTLTAAKYQLTGIEHI